MANGIDLILADHRKVDELFATFATTGDGTIIGQVIDALSAHDDAEHAALYPLVGHVLGDTDMIERSGRAHSAVKKQIDHIKALEGAPLTEAFDVLRQLVEEHVADEEENILPALAEQATAQQLEGLGARILQAKQRGG
ncbi:MAG: hemerythrin domain-containing protein [Acidimicrobiia bacterium]